MPVSENNSEKMDFEPMICCKHVD